MAKIKLENITGLISNYDDTLLKPEVAIDGANVFIGNGYFEDATPLTKVLSQDEKWGSEPQNYLPFLPVDWEWETGTFASITQDPLSEDKTVFTDTVLFLVGKGYEDGEYKRTIWYRKWTDNPDDAWTQPYNPITEASLTTALDGKVFFKNANGILKIYFPHDAFWFGYISRVIYKPTSDRHSAVTQIGYYFDRLVENSDFSNNIPTTVCAPGYRTGAIITSSIVDKPITIVTGAVKFMFRFKRFETWDSGDAQKQVVICEAVVTETNGDVKAGSFLENTFIEGYPGSKTTEWVFYRVWTTSGWDDAWVLPKSMADTIKTLTGAELTTLYNEVKSPRVSKSNQLLNTPYSDFLIFISGVDFPDVASDAPTTTFASTKATGSIESDGFAKVDNDVQLLVTTVLDETTEFITARQVVNTKAVTTAKFGVKLTLQLPGDFNRRTTRIRIYVKQKSVDPDFQLAYEYNLLEEINSSNLELVLIRGQVDALGTTLSQNIAFFLDEDKVSEYNIINGFNTITEIDGISIGLATGDTSNAYYSVLGGGNLQPDLVYKANVLPISFKDRLTAVASINNNFGVFGTNRLTLLRPDIANTSLIFSAIDAVELGAKDQEDVAEVQGGVIVNSPNGVFLTNGYNKQWLSEPINREVKDVYEDSYIVYNPYKQELMYFVNGTTVDYQVYSFEYQNWMKVKVGPDVIIKPLLDAQGNISFLIRESQ